MKKYLGTLLFVSTIVSLLSLPLMAKENDYLWDIAYCEQIGPNPAQVYAIDYLKLLNQQRLENPWSELVEISSFDEASKNIYNLLNQKFPALAWSFSEYQYFVGEDFFSEERIWRDVLGLPKLIDQNHEVLPEYCQGWLAQAINRLEFADTPKSAITYEYDEYFVGRLDDPLQRSYAFVREWLWDFFSPDQAINVRYLNDFLHSQAAWKLDPFQFQRLLIETWGLNVAKIKPAFKYYGAQSQFVYLEPYKFGACGIFDGKPFCWNSGGVVFTQYLEDATGLVGNMGTDGENFYGCALVEGAMRCFGSSFERHFKVLEQFSGIREIVGSNFAYCLILENGELECIYHTKKLAAPHLNQPRGLKESGLAYCAIDVLKGLFCWDLNSGIQLAEKDLGVSFDLSIHREIIDYAIFSNSVGKYDICVLEPHQAVCHSTNAYLAESAPKDLESPKKLVLNSGLACVLDSDRVRCWGEHIDAYASTLEKINQDLEQPYDILLTASDPAQGREARKKPLCVIDQKGLNCWDLVSGSLMNQFLASSFRGFP